MKIRLLLILAAGVILIGCGAETDTEAGITVAVGPTSIPRGDAVGANDITVNNGLFAANTN